MALILKARSNHITEIIALAKETWYATYSSLVPLEQIAFMLNEFYNEELLAKQINDPQHHFLVMIENERLIGYSHCIEKEDSVKLSKLYFSPHLQGKGYGKMLMQEIEKEVKLLGYSTIELCVNRGNTAQYFYEKMGFVITEEADFPIGDYWMNDYVMKKTLS